VRYLKGGKTNDDARGNRYVVLVRYVDARHLRHGCRVSIVDDNLRGLFRLQLLEMRERFPSKRVQIGYDSPAGHRVRMLYVLW
jgi:hypothetical protein